VQNISLLVAGTLIILITSMFVNAGAPLQISNDDKKPNQIVMNTVISAASGGLLISLTNQFSNVVWDDNT
jgi:ammonia channel protein AmtB